MPLLRTFAMAAAAALVSGAALAQEGAPAAPPAGSAAPAAPAEGAAPSADAAAPAPPSAAAQAYRPIAPAGDLASTLKASGQFTKFLALADKAGLTPLLTGARPLTLFVPTDAAIDGTPLAQEMPATELQPILVYHIYGALIPATELEGKKGPVQTAANKPIEVDGSVMPMKINDSVVLQANVQTTNGAIYVLDKPLTPPA